MLNGCGVDYDIALRALIPLYCVYANLHQQRNAEFADLTAYHGYLVAVGHNHAYSCRRVERRAIFRIGLTQQFGNYPRLLYVHFV